MNRNSVMAELLGTFWLVFGGCGCAILAATGAVNGIGPLGVSIAFGLSLVTAALTFGSASGAHFNPAVSVGMGCAGRLPWTTVARYVAAQVLGATLAATVLYAVANGRPEFDVTRSFAANGFGAHSPGGFELLPAFFMETICTLFFLLVILHATEPGRTSAAHVIGATLTLIHLVLIPITNASVNPARSTSQALFAGWGAVSQLWLFWAAPLLGAVFAAAIYSRRRVGPRH